MFAKGQTPPEPLVDLPVDDPEELPSSKSDEIAQSCHGLEGGTGREMYLKDCRYLHKSIEGYRIFGIRYESDSSRLMFR